MNSSVNELVKSSIDKNTLDECTVDELQQLVQQFPYFGPAQFLLAKKLKEEASPLFEQQRQKAVLYFQDQLWFDYLSGEGNMNGTMIASKPVEVAEPYLQTAVPEVAALQEQINGSIVTEEVIEEPIKTEEPVVIEQPVINELPEVSTEIITAPVEEVIEVPASTVATEDVSVILPPETVSAPIPEEIITPLIIGELVPAVVQEEKMTEASKPAANDFPTFKIQPMDKTANTLTFEPYHTVDYFASQGIRFRDEEKPKDRFGQQLKSFTQWLKSMKKLPETDASNAPAPPDDKKVTQLAEHSIENRDVFTEAMAEVWEKQGNTVKAVEIYRKLSLLNPDKSSYFAAKIDHLKNL